ncbi:hypothetical protein O9992_02060 [Vibrio lentus]|nr:hypothetical protein [Vibrio lentus]
MIESVGVISTSSFACNEFFETIVSNSCWVNKRSGASSPFLSNERDQAGHRPFLTFEQWRHQHVQLGEIETVALPKK